MAEEIASEKSETSEDTENSATITEVPDQRPYESVEEPARKRHERLVEQWKEIRRQERWATVMRQAVSDARD